MRFDIVLRPKQARALLNFTGFAMNTQKEQPNIDIDLRTALIDFHEQLEKKMKLEKLLTATDKTLRKVDKHIKDAGL